MRDEGYRPEEIGAYGATAQPAIAARMRPHLRMTLAGAVCGLLGAAAAIGAVATFPNFSSAANGGTWAVVAMVCAVLMLAISVIQVLVWRRAMASWRGVRLQDLRAEARLSWIVHLVSYAVVLVALWACIAAGADAGWTTTAGALLGVTLVLVVAGQVLAGVQYLRPGGPPGTVPAHIRHLVELSRRRND